MLLINAHLCTTNPCIMKQVILSLLVCSLLAHHARAQNARQTKIDYQQGQKIAAHIELPFSLEIVEGAIRKRLESATVKEERTRGMQVFKGGRVTPTDGEAVDFYFRLTRKGRGEQGTCDVYLILGRPNENVGLRLANDDYRINDARKFLESLVPVVTAFKLETDIKSSEDLISRSERNLKNLASEQKYLEDRIQELQEKLAQNRREQETESAELSRQRTIRDSLVSRRVTASK
jgi:hypothetical protein